MKALFMFLLALFIPISLHSEPLPIDSVMTPAEKQKCGLDKLTPEQKKAFEDWLGSWTQKVLDQSETYHPSKSIKRWISEWPKKAQPVVKASPEATAEEQKTLNQRIYKITENGGTIELYDGSIWSVYEVDRNKVNWWQKNNEVEAVKTDSDTPPYRLKNYSKAEIADVKLVNPPQASGQRLPSEREEFEGALQIINIYKNGEIIDLSDGSRWKISLTGQVKTSDLHQVTEQFRTSNWRVGDRVRVKKTDDLLYEYSLSNLDVGETVLANRDEWR